MRYSFMTPLFCTAELDATTRFYRDRLGFRTTAELEGYVELQQGERGPRIAFMAPSPDGKWQAAKPEGLMWCFAVDNADAEHARLLEEGVTIRETPEDRPWGERAFVAVDPNGVALYFGHPIPSNLEIGAGAE